MNAFRRARLVFWLIWRIDKGYYCLLLLGAFSQAGQVMSNVLLPRRLIDALMGVPGAGDPWRWVLTIALVNLLFVWLRKAVQRLRRVKESSVQMEVDKAFADKLMRLPYPTLEDPYYLDLKERASFAMRNQSAVGDLVDITVNNVSQLATVLGLILVMLQLGIGLLGGLLLCVALMLLIQMSFSRYQQRFFQEILPINRRYGYYVGLAFSDRPQKDLRLYGMAKMLGDRITAYNRHINEWYGRFFRRMGLFMGLFQVIIVLQTALAYGLVGLRTLQDGLGIGSLTMYVTAAISFSSAVITLGTNLVQAGQKLNYLSPFAELMDLPEEAELAGSARLDRVDSIVFDEVTFTYPKGDKLVLDRVSFEIRKGERVSIVGRNGAGKSTIVKLLCRLYTQDSGRILINCRDIADYDKVSFMRSIAAVFQDFQLFCFPICENITCEQTGADDARLRQVIDQVGLADKLASLPQGWQTPLGRAFDPDAVELSGGERQKVALARALYKDASLLVLDEPTSALDPLAEAEVYAQMDRMAGERTAIFISHRMSSSVFYDRILVLDEGRVQAFDTHQRLMADHQGLYYRLFQSQAAHYQLPES